MKTLKEIPNQYWQEYKTEEVIIADNLKAEIEKKKLFKDTFSELNKLNNLKIT